MYELRPAGHVQNRGVHVVDTDGIVADNRSAGDWSVCVRIVGSKAGFANKQVEGERLDPRGEDDLEINFGMERHDYGIGLGL